MASKVLDLVGGNVFSGVKGLIEEFHLSPDKAQQFQEKLIDQINTEVAAAADVIKAEANSQSWLPRNVRPLLLLIWGSAISVNIVVTVLARFWYPNLQPVTLDPWVYKLTAIGFTGYVTARSWEKVTGTA
jgi:hypothetical protein